MWKEKVPKSLKILFLIRKISDCAAKELGTQRLLFPSLGIVNYSVSLFKMDLQILPVLPVAW